jgi:hypothetical protein
MRGVTKKGALQKDGKVILVAESAALKEDESYWDNDPVLHRHRENLSGKLNYAMNLARNLTAAQNYYGCVGKSDSPLFFPRFYALVP